MKKATSITRKITVALSTLISTEIVFLVAIFILGNVNNRLKDNSYIAFNENIKSQALIVEDKFVESYNIVNSKTAFVSQTITEYFGSLTDFQNASVETQSEYLADVVPDLISIMKEAQTSGIYLILNKQGNSSKEGVYLKDTNLKLADNSNSDVVAAVGRNSTISPNEIRAGKNYTSCFYSEAPDNGVYYLMPDFMPDEVSTGGYESKWNTYQLKNEKARVIICNIPVLIGNNLAAVIGFDMDIHYFNAYYPYQNMTFIPNSGFGFGILNQKVLTTCFLNGPILNAVENVNEITYEANGINDNGYIASSRNLSYSAIVSAQRIGSLKLNNRIDPNWIFMGFVNENILFETAELINNLMSLTIAITMIFGILIIFFVIRFVAKPLKQLSAEVKSKEFRTAPTFERTNILELNDLIGSIEGLSQDVFTYSQKITNAIDIFSLGIFFHQDVSNTVYCTQPFFDICGIDQKEGYCDRKLFESWLAKITNSYFDFNFSAYHLDNTKWVKVVTKKEGNFNIGIITDVTGHINEIRKIEQERDIDPLTKLFNRNAFYKAAQKIFAASTDKAIAVIMWDIDKLKYINDTYGHEFGDRYITKFAEVIKTLEMFGGIVCRRSGDEFLGLISGDTQSEVIKTINALRDRINDSGIQISDKMYEKLRISTGIAWYPEDGDSIDTLINYADYALYEVKYNYRGITNYFNKDSYPNHSFLIHFNDEFEKIINGDFVTFAYQPIVDCKTGELYGFEFLMRIFSEIINSPAKLMSIAKLQSKTDAIEKLTFRKGFEAYQENLPLIEDKRIFINSFANINLSKEEYKNYFHCEGLEMMVVEFTDYVGVEDSLIKKKAEALKEIHAQIALDNCGTDGYNNLLLQKVAYDFVKVDLTIIDNIDIDEQHQKILDNIQKYARSKNSKVIAVGVKSYEEMKYLIEAGVDYIQGYYVGMPAAKPSVIEQQVKDQIIEIASKRF